MASRRRLSLLSTLALAGVLNPAVAFADGSTPAPKSGSDFAPFSLLISPPRLAISQEEVDTTQQVKVMNRGQSTTTIEVHKRNFTAKPDGSLDYQRDAPYAASDWLTVSPSRFAIAPGETQVVNADVHLPEAPEPGDHQVALVFMVPSAGAEGNIKINRGIATPVFITVPGPVDDRVSLTGLKAPGFVKGGKIQITATMQNIGTVHRDFRAPSPLTIKSAGKASPFPDFTVPRGATRNISTEWKPPFMCICRPTVTFDNDGVQQVSSVRVIVFPWHLFAGTAAALLLLLLLTRLGRRRYHAQVLKAAALHNAGSSGDA